ncbi:MAG TPA: hypothetical protein VK652_05300 [Steroidobacteraceae bacterium]|nr:hypothetical protein [Steroidobacteraceae bacterium]
MRGLKLGLAFMLAGVFCSPAWAQLEEIVVTGSRASGDDYSKMPAVVLQQRADFLVQRIRLTNDTRAEDARTKELHQTIRDMVGDASKQSGIALSYGDEFLIPITSTAYEVPLTEGGKRADTSSTSIYVKMALGERDDVPGAIARLRGFIKKARVSGRTEIEPDGDVGLSLVTPEKYRYNIIAKITEDAKRLHSTVGTQCRIRLSGLSNRVSWQRSDVSELTLYIAYGVELTDCQ